MISFHSLHVSRQHRVCNLFNNKLISQFLALCLSSYNYLQHFCCCKKGGTHRIYHSTYMKFFFRETENRKFCLYEHINSMFFFLYFGNVHDTIYGNSNLYFNQTQIICHTDLTQKNMSERQQSATNKYILLRQKKNKVK